MKHVPNILSIIRIILVILILFFYKNGWIFASLYVAVMLSDVLDGYIARKTQSQSAFGARLDSFADVLMYGIIIVLIFYWVRNLLAPFVIWIVVIAGIRVTNILIAVYKYHTFAGLHTWGNKLAGLLLFLAPIIFIVSKDVGYLWFVCLVALLSAIEEGIIHLTSRTLNENRRSIFLKDY